MIKAEWTNNDALSTGQTTYSNAHNTLNALDCVSRQYAIEHYQHVCRRTACKECPLHIQVTDTFTDCELELFLHNLPSAQPEYTEQDVRDSFNSGYACGMEAAQSTIIHCKDCVHYGRADKRRFYRGYDCLDGRIASIVPDRDFCSRAVRRKESDG